MTTPAIVAVVPFGARGRDARAGAIGRQLARRLVDRFAAAGSIELRPVFLVAMGETKADAGYLVFGSTPDVLLAAGYGKSLGTTHALTGLYADDGERRTLAVTLVDVASRAAQATREFAVVPGTLHRVEEDVAAWLAATLGGEVPAAEAAAANEPAYVALLEGLDEEVNATLLRSGEVTAERAARARALSAYAESLKRDAHAALAEERLLVLAAESIERGDEERAIAALEDAVESRQSWRLHYLLGQLRRQSGDVNGAIVALEHAHALHPLGDADAVALAELYIAAGAPGQAASHLRRVREPSAEFGRAQQLLGLVAVARGDAAAARTHLERAAASGVAGARIDLARALIASGDVASARRELDEIIATSDTPDTVAQARRLRLGVDRPDLEADLERAGRTALSADGAALDDARAAFERVLGYEPDLWEAHFGLGLIARRREDAPGAAAAFRRVLELSPAQPDALHELGVALLASGSDMEALRALDEAAALRPRDAAYLADAGFAHLRAGDLVTARERLRLASEIDADDPLTRAYLEELERAEASVGRAN